MGISHRDLKPENILVSKTCQTIRVADFGISSTSTGLLRDLCGTPPCCPPQVFRLAVQLNEWAYYTSNRTLTIGLYGSGRVSAKIPGIGDVHLIQETDYPWEGAVKLTVEMAPDKEFSLALRIPNWAVGSSIDVNGKKNDTSFPEPGTIASLSRIWRK